MNSLVHIYRLRVKKSLWVRQRLHVRAIYRRANTARTSKDAGCVFTSGWNTTKHLVSHIIGRQ